MGWRVGALVAASVAAAQAAAFGVLLLWPPPEPPRMGVGQVIEAFDASESDLRAAGLRREVVDRPPFATGAGPGLTRLIASSLAEGLGRPADAVRVGLVEAADPQGTTVLPAVRNAPSFTIRSRQGAATPFAIAPGGARGITVVTPGALLRSLPPALPPFEAAVRRPDGRWTVIGLRKPLVSPWRLRVLLAFATATLLLAPVGWWSARRLTRPVRLFADAADRLGLDPDAPPVPVEGPAEVRIAAASFNRMQDRLRRYLEARTAMMAAIAHDLRTPLTSLRLRAETAPEAERARMASDVARMESMIAQMLAFVRGEQVRDARERFDLRRLAAECVAETVEHGGRAELAPGEPTPVEGERLNLRRAVSNLLDNASAYGGGGTVVVRAEAGAVVLRVLDDGPGLPDAELERVLEPFARLEPSRSRETGGVGLGLASARAIVRSHGGSLRLSNRPEGGLQAEIRLPVSVQT